MTTEFQKQEDMAAEAAFQKHHKPIYQKALDTWGESLERLHRDRLRADVKADRAAYEAANATRSN